MSLTPRFHTLRVSDVRRETPSAVSIAFAIPEHLREAFRFAAGQYLTLRRRFEGEEVRRSYSICSGPDDGELRIAVKRIDGGVFSDWANNEIALGDSLEVMTPIGRFGIAHRPYSRRVYAAFAAGSGITPVVSITRAILAREPGSRVFLFYGNRTASDMLFGEELADLKDRYMRRLSLFHVLSREQRDVPILNGRLDAAKVRALLAHVVPASAIDHAFICGPAAMSEEITATFAELGLAPEQVHVELFVSALGGIPRQLQAPPPEAVPYATASLIADGKRTEIAIAAGESILDAALRAGLDLPFACKGGMCSTCRARLLQGTTEMAQNFSLEAWEIAAGFVLTCQARPTSERVVVDYDQV